MNEEIPKETPWGPPQDIEVEAPGIVWISTASHGGYWLAPEVNKQIPLRVRRKTFCQNGLQGFYEEDEDAAIVRQYLGHLTGSGSRSVPKQEEITKTTATEK